MGIYNSMMEGLWLSKASIDCAHPRLISTRCSIITLKPLKRCQEETSNKPDLMSISLRHTRLMWIQGTIQWLADIATLMLCDTKVKLRIFMHHKPLLRESITTFQEVLMERKKTKMLRVNKMGSIQWVPSPMQMWSHKTLLRPILSTKVTHSNNTWAVTNSIELAPNNISKVDHLTKIQTSCKTING